MNGEGGRGGGCSVSCTHETQNDKDKVNTELVNTITAISIFT